MPLPGSLLIPTYIPSFVSSALPIADHADPLWTREVHNICVRIYCLLTSFQWVFNFHVAPLTCFMESICVANLHRVKATISQSCGRQWPHTS